MKLVTDGEKWAIKKWTFLLGIHFYDFVWKRWNWLDSGYHTSTDESHWADKETAEKVFRRLKA